MLQIRPAVLDEAEAGARIRRGLARRILGITGVLRVFGRISGAATFPVQRNASVVHVAHAAIGQMPRAIGGRAPTLRGSGLHEGETRLPGAAMLLRVPVGAGGAAVIGERGREQRRTLQ